MEEETDASGEGKGGRWGEREREGRLLHARKSIILLFDENSSAQRKPRLGLHLTTPPAETFSSHFEYLHKSRDARSSLRNLTLQNPRVWVVHHSPSTS